MLTITTTGNTIKVVKDGQLIAIKQKGQLWYNYTVNGVYLFPYASKNDFITETWGNGVTLDGEEVAAENVEEKFEGFFLTSGGGLNNEQRQKLDAIRINGDGTDFFSSDGTYKPVALFDSETVSIDEQANQANVNISAAADNALIADGMGLYVPAPSSDTSFFRPVWPDTSDFVFDGVATLDNIPAAGTYAIFDYAQMQVAKYIDGTISGDWQEVTNGMFVLIPDSGGTRGMYILADTWEVLGADLSNYPTKQEAVDKSIAVYKCVPSASLNKNIGAETILNFDTQITALYNNGRNVVSGTFVCDNNGTLGVITSVVETVVYITTISSVVAALLALPDL